MFNDISFNHGLNEPHNMTSINVSMVFHGREIADAVREASLMIEAAGLLHLANAIARRDNVFIGSDGASVQPRDRPRQEPAPTQRQPTGKRNIDLG